MLCGGPNPLLRGVPDRQFGRGLRPGFSERYGIPARARNAESRTRVRPSLLRDHLALGSGRYACDRKTAVAAYRSSLSGVLNGRIAAVSHD